MMKKIYTICCLLCLCSCVRENLNEDYRFPSGKREVAVSISGDALPPYGTRSSVTAAESGLGAVDIFFYHSGILCRDLTVNGNAAWADSYTAVVQLDYGKTYDVLVLGNSDVHSAPERLQDALQSLKYVADGISGWNSGGLPMAGRTSFTVSPAMSDIYVALERLVARFTLNIDTSGLEHGRLKITSVAVKQMNRECPYFLGACATRSGGVCDGDLASPAEIASINASGGRSSMTFYLTENLQGELLPWNGDPDLKIPREVAQAGGDPELCTYIEILGLYSDSSGMMTGEPLTARLFLGANATSDFDVRRNSLYEIDLRISDSACLRADWKVDGNISDRRVLRFNSSSGTVDAGASLSVSLDTNLSHSRGDFSYSVSGDTMCFSVQALQDATTFLVSSIPSAPSGAGIEIVAASWDGRLVTRYTATVKRDSSADYDISWKGDGGMLYVAQMRELEIKDKRTGAYPSGKVEVSTVYGHAGLSWLRSVLRVYGHSAGDDIIKIKVDGNEIAEFPISVAAPVMRFASEEIFLPLDGAMVMAGPYYYRMDGRRMDYSEFDPDLYYELLDISLNRSMDASQKGRYWAANGYMVNPAVGDLNIGGDYNLHGLSIVRLKPGNSAYDIAANYDFSGGARVYLENLVGYPSDMDTGIEPAQAKIYTMDPFTSSMHLGERESWVLARWPATGPRDETFSFYIDDTILPGNDYSFAGAVYPFSSENKYEFSFKGSRTVEMKVLYAENSESAMPEKYFTFAPVMRNRNSGEAFRSDHRYSVNFTVNLCLGATVSYNGANGCDVQVEWAFPQKNTGLLSDIEDRAVACTASGHTSAKGMNRLLYTVYGYSLSGFKEAFYPEYCLCDFESGARLPGAGSYRVPEKYGLGYDMVLWKYESLYPDAGGWLPK